MDHSDDTRRPWNPRLTAASVLAVVLVAAAVSLALYPRRPPAPTPAPSVHAVTVVALQVPPANRPLLWFRDSSEASAFVLRAVDWEGRALGSLSVSCGACGALASPDGQRLLIGSQSEPGASSNPDRVFDSAGRQLAAVDGFQAIWSDDSNHICALRSASGDSSTELAVTDVATGRTRFAGTLSTSVPPSAGSWTLASCSMAADRAVAEFFGEGVRALRVMQPSTGRTVLTGTDVSGACGCPINSVVVSGNGTLAAENLSGNGGGVRAIDLLTGRQLPLQVGWTGRGPVLGLSWSGGRAVTPVGVYSFPGGDAQWQAPLPSYMIPSATDPRGDEMLISVWLSSMASGQPIIVRRDGGATKLPGSYLSQPPLPY